jgi:hypothetical protein
MIRGGTGAPGDLPEGSEAGEEIGATHEAGGELEARRSGVCVPVPSLVSHEESMPCAMEEESRRRDISATESHARKRSVPR